MICHRYDYGADADNDDVEEEDDADADDYGDDNDDDVRGNWNVSSEEGIEAKTVDIWEARPAEGDPWYADHHHMECNDDCTNFDESIMIKTVSNPTTPIDDCMTNHNDDCDKRGVGGITMVMIELLQVKNREMAGFHVHAPRRDFNFQCQEYLWKLVSIFFSFWHKTPLPLSLLQPGATQIKVTLLAPGESDVKVSSFPKSDSWHAFLLWEHPNIFGGDFRRSVRYPGFHNIITIISWHWRHQPTIWLLKLCPWPWINFYAFSW